MYHCGCHTCILNGLQGRSYTVYSEQQYCTSHPSYISVVQYQQMIAALDDLRMPVPARVQTVVTPKPKPKRDLDTYVLSFRDARGVEQDWFIKSDDDEEASEQAMKVIKNLPFSVQEFTFIKETHVSFIRLLNR